jgi:hypothetical protein
VTLTGTTLNLGIVQVPGRTRACGIWISAYVDQTTVIDTAALGEGDARHAGSDRFPADCVLVVVSPRAYRRWVEYARGLQHETSGPAEAAAYLDRVCTRDQALADRLGWRLPAPVVPGSDRRE